MSIQTQQIGSGTQAGAVATGTLALIAVGLLLAIAIVVLILRPDSEPIPSATDMVIAPASKEARGDAARDIIAELQNTTKASDAQTSGIDEELADDESLNETADNEPIDEESDTAVGGEDDNARAYARAQAFHAEGKLADAQLLYFFAARGGYAPAAFDLATFYDPNHFSTQSSLMKEPDPYQAYKWYRQSLQLGIHDAEARLAKLYVWTEGAADSGDMKAEQLLMLWE